MSSVNYQPNLEERLNPSIALQMRFRDMVMQSLRVAVPAIVQSFDPGPPATVSVVVATNEYRELNQGGAVISLKTNAVPLPILTGVPVQMPGAGIWTLTFPIQPGDECLLVFADTPIDVWFQNGGINNDPIQQRRHDLSDAIAQFGLRSQPRAIQNFSTDSAQLRNDDGTVLIEMKPDTINIVATENVNITAPKATVTCSDTATVTGNNVKLDASHVTIGNDTKIDGIGFLGHYHIAPAGGGPTGGAL